MLPSPYGVHFQASQNVQIPHTIAVTTVTRSRVRSSAVPPARVDDPPNSSDMPLPRPEWSRIVRIKKIDAMMSMVITTAFSTTRIPFG